LSSEYVYDNLNRLLEDDDYVYTYDNNGNLISKVDKVTSDTTVYQYDAEDRLIQVTTPTDIVLYQYDGFGRRIAKTLNGVVTKYVYDREDILFELDENDQIKARYTHGPGIPALPAGRDEPISVDRDTNGDGVFDVTYYYQYDGLGSITAITDTSGNVVQTYVYDAFGKIVQQTGSIDNPYTYTGREWDAEAGLYFYRARYYDVNTGRFIQNDPIGFNGGDVNFYAYVRNNPANFIDPYGLWKGLLPKWGPKWHHDRNKYQACPDKEPKTSINSGCGGNNWYFEGNSPTHGGNKSYRGIGPNKGFQCVYNDKGNLVRNTENWGTYDYFPPYFDSGIPNPLMIQHHFIFDVLPWVLFGN
jgi:RHS repeat-associated protein